MPAPNNISGCLRCGTCCRKGGPVLHQEDLQILLKGFIGYSHLMTIRKGERAYNPLTELSEPVAGELIKIRDCGTDHACLFLNENGNSCSVYENRLLECRLLKCWDTGEIAQIIGKNTLIRRDIINSEDLVLEIIESHEQECPASEIEELLSSMYIRETKKALARITEIVRKDISIRRFAFKELELNKDYELFIFGRPVHQILQERGLSVKIGS